MKDSVIINGYVALDRWGVNFTDGAISELMTPAPTKDGVENKTRVMDGKQVFADTSDGRWDERDIVLPFYILADSRADFFARYNLFCQEVLRGKWFTLSTSYIPDTLFRLEYKSCQQFTQFRQGMALFSLKVNEADPSNRSTTIVTYDN